MTTDNKVSAARTPDHGLTGIEPATDAPWNVYNCSDGSINVCGNKDYPDGVCKILWSGRRARDIANARLIAAAPELLEALQVAVKVLEKPFATIGQYQEFYRLSRAAIAKAEGRA
jgi:hypothetical protein